MKLSEAIFVAFDTETTGLSPYSHVVEVGAVKFKGNHIVDTFCHLVKPPVPIPAVATKIHGITNEMVKEKDGFEVVGRGFLKFIEGAILIAHNAPFDLKVLTVELKRCGLPVPGNTVIDTKRLSRAFFPELPSHSLPYLRKVWGSPISKAHRALLDARNVAYIFLRMLYKWGLAPDGELELLLRMTRTLKFNQFEKRLNLKVS